MCIHAFTWNTCIYVYIRLYTCIPAYIFVHTRTEHISKTHKRKATPKRAPTESTMFDGTDMNKYKHANKNTNVNTNNAIHTQG